MSLLTAISCLQVNDAIPTRRSKGTKGWWKTWTTQHDDRKAPIERQKHWKHTRWRTHTATGLERPPQRQLLAHHAVAMQASKGKDTTEVYFDTDSGPVGIDNRASACISHESADIVGPLTKSNRVIKSFGGGRTKSSLIGTLKWTWLDDNGTAHTSVIPNSYYVPEGKVRLLSPQHWAQAHQKTTKKRAWETTNASSSILYWSNGKHKRTTYMDRTTNVATFYLAPRYGKYSSFCMEAGIDNEENDNPITIDPAMVSDDEDEYNNQQIPKFKPTEKVPKPTEQTTHADNLDLD